MPSRLPFVYIAHLISELRLTARESMDDALYSDEMALLSSSRAALMNDAAEALETMMAERTANRSMPINQSRRDDRQG